MSYPPPPPPLPLHNIFGNYDDAYKAAEKAELNRQHIPPPSYPPPSYPPPSYPSYPSYPPPPPLHNIFGNYEDAYKAAEMAELNRQHIPHPSYPPPPPSYPPPPPSYPPPPPERDSGPNFGAAYTAAEDKLKLPDDWRKATEPETGKTVWVHDETGRMSYAPPPPVGAVGGAKNKKKHSCRTKRRRHRRKASRRSTGNK